MDRGEQIFMKSGDRVQGGGKMWTDDGPDKHVIGMLFFEDFSRKKRIGKKAKRWRGRGAYEEEDGIRARKNGVEGKEIWGEKREKRCKSGLGKRSFIVTD